MWRKVLGLLLAVVVLLGGVAPVMASAPDKDSKPGVGKLDGKKKNKGKKKKHKHKKKKHGKNKNKGGKNASAE